VLPSLLFVAMGLNEARVGMLNTAIRRSYIEKNKNRKAKRFLYS